MSLRRLASRLVGAIVHNWPLKLAAIAAAVLLYVGLVAAQDSITYPGPIPVTAVNVPPGTIVTNNPLRSVDAIRYIAPADMGRLTNEDFRPTVDLSGLSPTGSPVNVRVDVQAIDSRVTILDVQPRTIPVTLDQEVTAQVPVVVSRGPAPPGAVAGPTQFTPQQVVIRGPSTAVKRVVELQVQVTLNASGIDFDQEVEGTPVDASGAPVTGVDVVPRTVHVTIPLYTNTQTRTVPVTPVFTGTPAPGFRVAGVIVSPLTVTLQGDADQLASLSAADTATISLDGATRTVAQQVGFSLPVGVTPVGASTVNVTVQIAPVTETRTYSAGLRLDGADPNFQYAVSVNSVLLSVYGNTADLDRLSASPITVGLDVAGLGVGRHQLTVVPSLPSAVTVVSINPLTVEVTIATLSSPFPSPSPTGAGPGPSPTPAPS